MIPSRITSLEQKLTRPACRHSLSPIRNAKFWGDGNEHPAPGDSVPVHVVVVVCVEVLLCHSAIRQ